MAITPNVIQPSNQGSNALFQLAQILGQQSQFQQTQDQRAEEFGIVTEAKRKEAEEKILAERALVDEENKRKAAQAKWDRYLEIPADRIYKNKSVLEDFVQSGVTLGQFSEDTSFDEVSAVLSSTKSEILAQDKLTEEQRRAQSTEDRLAWDKYKWQNEFELKLQDSSITADDKLQLVQLGKIQEQLLNTPADERGKLIKKMGWDKIADNFNANIASKNSWEPINITVTDEGDFKPWTPRFVGDVSVGKPTEKPVPKISAGLEKQLTDLAVQGDEQAIADLEAAGKDTALLKAGAIRREEAVQAAIARQEIQARLAGQDKFLSTQIDYNPYGAVNTRR